MNDHREITGWLRAQGHTSPWPGPGPAAWLLAPRCEERAPVTSKEEAFHEPRQPDPVLPRPG